MYDVKDWAEVHRLFERERWAKTAIAAKLGMSRNTVDRLLALNEPPNYERPKKSSMLEAFEEPIAAMLAEDPKVAATVVRERLQRLGYSGGITILKERLAELRPGFLAARSYQRTSYLPGELAQLDWWHTGAEVPVGKGAAREAFGLVASLPHSAAHATCFTLGRTTPEFCAAVLGCFVRLGGLPELAIVDNEGCIVKPRRGGPAVFVDDAIFETGDSRHTGRAEGHACQHYRWREVVALGNDAGGELLGASASNWASLSHEETVAELASSPEEWRRFLDHEVAACRGTRAA